MNSCKCPFCDFVCEFDSQDTFEDLMLGHQIDNHDLKKLVRLAFKDKIEKEQDKK